MKRLLSMNFTCNAVRRYAARPYEDIPHEKGLPFFGSLFDFIKSGGYNNFYSELHKKHGEIFRFKMLGKNNVSVSSADHIKETYLLNQAYPLRETVEPWVAYRKKRGLPLSIVMSLSPGDEDYDSWKRFRNAVKGLLEPKLVASYTPRVVTVAQDFVQGLAQTKGEYQSLDFVRLQTAKYGFEAICSILMGKTFGLMVGKSTPESEQYFKAVRDMFDISDKMLFKELLWRWFPTKSREISEKSWDTIFEIGGRFVDTRHDELDPRFAGDNVTSYLDMLSITIARSN